MALGEPRDWSGEDGSRSTLGFARTTTGTFRRHRRDGQTGDRRFVQWPSAGDSADSEKAAAILEAWFPGVQGGNGVADVLFGDVDPAGRLTTTFHTASGRCRSITTIPTPAAPASANYKGNYADGPIVPLYPFGFGLAYTTFEFGKVHLERAGQ